MLFLPVVLRPTKIIRISSTANNVNLYTQANTPYPVNVIAFVDANIGS